MIAACIFSLSIVYILCTLIILVIISLLFKDNNRGIIITINISSIYYS